MNKSLRIAVGRLWQETNTFSEARTSLEAFQRSTFLTGEDLIASLQLQEDELAGFADILVPAGIEIVPLAAISAWCGGPAEEEAVDAITRVFVESATTEVDGVLLSLHGALAGVRTFDVSGHVTAAIRDTIGTQIPFVATFDHHGNITQKIIDSIDALTAYHHCPHTDMRETGRRGARLLLEILEGKLRPRIVFRKLPLVTPCEGFLTAQSPMRNWHDLARTAESARRVRDASLFAVQPWLDVPELGWSVVVVADSESFEAEDVADELASHAWSHREDFFFSKYEPGEAVQMAAAHPEGPVVIADGADATNGGSPGDSTCLLGEMLKQNITCSAFLTIVDKEAVAAAIQAGIGGEFTVSLGAKWSSKYHQPVEVSARVERFSDGHFELKGHIAQRVNMGRCAVLQSSSIRILVSEFAGPGHDPEVYRHIGLEPLEAQIVVVKATVGHMDAYRDIMKLNLPTECPGPSPSRLERLDYSNVPRPIYPLDPDTSYP
jgi:microcystin degradation protein MlrC